MSSDSTTLHIPMSRSLRKRLEAKAKRSGFDSVQAYIRVWAQAEADGRILDFGDDWGQPTPKAAARLDQLAREAIADSKAGKLKAYHSVEDLMKDLGDAQSD